MSSCDALKAVALNFLTNRAGWTAPTTWYISLHTDDPGADGTENEISGMGYTRKSVAANSGQWTAPSAGVVENINNLAWSAASGDWTTITHFAIHTASTGATGYIKQALVTPIPIPNGAFFQFAPGKLRVSVL